MYCNGGTGCRDVWLTSSENCVFREDEEKGLRVVDKEVTLLV